MPATAASRYRAGFSESSLWVTRRPSGRRATMSVKVPPRSIQNCHLPDTVDILLREQRDREVGVAVRGFLRCRGTGGVEPLRQRRAHGGDGPSGDPAVGEGAVDVAVGRRAVYGGIQRVLQSGSRLGD